MEAAPVPLNGLRDFLQVIGPASAGPVFCPYAKAVENRRQVASGYMRATNGSSDRHQTVIAWAGTRRLYPEIIP